MTSFMSFSNRTSSPWLSWVGREEAQACDLNRTEKILEASSVGVGFSAVGHQITSKKTIYIRRIQYHLANGRKKQKNTYVP